MRTVNYKEKDYEDIFLEMMKDAYQYKLLSTDERFLEYIKNRQDIENNYCLLLSVYAFENNKIYEDMTLIYNSNDLDKATGKDLDIIGNKFSIPRPQARKSSVELTFYFETAKNTDFVIPRGTVVTTENGTSYYTVEEAVIVRGQFQTNVTAYSSLSGFNTRVDRKTLKYCNLGGNVQVINLKGSSGGRGEYTDDEYRRLIKNWAYSHIKGTKEAYELFFAYYDGVDDYRLVPLWDGAGTLKVIVDPDNDWILNDIKTKLLQNVQLLDDDVKVVGAVKRAIDIDVNVNIDIDSIDYYSVEQRETIAKRVANAIELYVDGGYKRNGRYHKGLGIGNDFVPFQCSLFVAGEIPELKSIDFKDTIKNIDNTLYAYEFYTDKIGEDTGYSESANSLVANKGRVYTSPMIYTGQAYKVVSDAKNFDIIIVKEGNEISFSNPSFRLDGEDLYGCYIKLVAREDNATLTKLTIYESENGNDDNSYNTHVNIGDDEIAVCGNVNVTIQDGTANKSASVVCY